MALRHINFNDVDSSNKKNDTELTRAFMSRYVVSWLKDLRKRSLSWNHQDHQILMCIETVAWVAVLWIAPEQFVVYIDCQASCAELTGELIWRIKNAFPLVPVFCEKLGVKLATVCLEQNVFLLLCVLAGTHLPLKCLFLSASTLLS